MLPRRTKLHEFLRTTAAAPLSLDLGSADLAIVWLALAAVAYYTGLDEADEILD